MTLEELKTIKKDLKEREQLIDSNLFKLSKEKSELHKKLREAYKIYVDEHFPFKVGDKCRYSFINRDGDFVMREIIITEISAHRCLLNEITISYEIANHSMTDTIWGVDIDGTLTNGIDKLEKL